MSVAPKEAKEPKEAPDEKAAPAGASAAEAPAEKGAKKEKGGKAKDGKEPKEGKGKGKSAASTKTAKIIADNPNFRYIVRVANSDLDGTRPAGLALTGVRGVGMRIAEATCRMSHVNPAELIGNLPEATVEVLETTLGTLPTKVPVWMTNHPREPFLGESPHLIGPDLETRRRDDVNVMKMVRSYRGVRHERGQKVRGQRTRSNGRTGMAAGVIKKTAREAAAAAGKEAPSGGGGGAAPAATPAATPAPATPAAKKV
ncbi:MAG TPA: 30S ribosomal protein S13 [Thermoplasmata archaeon]|nr:30S ribosomal protein S13 [Thermoplasmata archaeon]